MCVFAFIYSVRLNAFFREGGWGGALGAPFFHSGALAPFHEILEATLMLYIIQRTPQAEGISYHPNIESRTFPQV